MKVKLFATSIITIFVILYLLNLTTTFGQQVISPVSVKNGSNFLSKTENQKNDTERPIIEITDPAYPPTITSNKVIIKGTSSDPGSGIHNITAVAHTFPFQDKFPIPFASEPIPNSPDNWSHWSVPLVINETNTYRVVLTAIDNAGNRNYAETTINAVIPKNNSDSVSNPPIPKIVLVRPTFTEAAYQEGGFYRFYFKHGFPPMGKKITSDLEMLTVKTPKSVSEFTNNNIKKLSNLTSLVPINGTEFADVSQQIYPYPQKFWMPFIDHIKKVTPDATLTIMRDEDVHDGHIFYQGNKTNAFDILLLFHNEYVTQTEYDNLRQFVSNGGTIVFIDANALYAEVKYDRNNHTIRLVKGHDWKFDGVAASRSVPERWYEENKEWVGSNFLINEIKENITFANNPFNYTHFEEQFVNNPKTKVIMDYAIKFPKDYVESYLKKEKLPAELHREDIPIENITVASYSMEYGKGKVIMMGISGRLLSENQKFLKFFDDVILPKAMCPKFQSCTFLPLTQYLYGCTDYKYYGYHCDPISTEFKSSSVLADYTKIASATRDPSFTKAKFGNGLNITGAHGLESLRANVLNAYDSGQFSVYLSYMPHKYDDSLGNPYESLVSYKNGVFRRDSNNVGWEIELIPNNSTSTKTLHFTVFDKNGAPRSTDNIDIPTGEFSEITGTFNGTIIKLFINGVLKSEVPFPGIYDGHVAEGNFIKFGGDAYCSCYLANGILDEVRYYNSSLSNEQVKQINSDHELLSQDLIGHWKLDSDLKDSSNLKNDMFYNTLISSMAFVPDGRMFFTEKNSGDIRIMVNNTVLEKPFASVPNLHVDFEQGLLGIAIDSKFEKNHFVYVYYNYKDQEYGDVFARIVRFTDNQNKGIEETIILDRIPASSTGFHTGGALSFNKIDDKLYATIGDGIDAKSAQNLSSLKGKTIRLNRDGSIPKDNPFPNSLVYTLGHRNMFGIAFNEMGNGIITEPGSALYDEINSHIAGANYGWRTMQPANTRPDPLFNDSSIKPLRSYYIAENPTQATYYNGDKHPDLKGKFIVGSFRGDLYALQTSEDGKKLLEEIRINTGTYPSKEIVATAVSPQGDIFFGAYDIFMLQKIDSTSTKQTMFPIQINATGINVLNVNYSSTTNEIRIDLSKNYGLSSFSVKIPTLILDDVPEGYGCYPKNNFSSNQFPNIEIPYQIGLHRNKDNTIITVQLLDYSKSKLSYVINTDSFDPTRLDVCLIKAN